MASAFGRALRRRYDQRRHRLGSLPERDRDLREAHEERDAGSELDDLLGGEAIEQLAAGRFVDVAGVAEEGVGEADRRLVPFREIARGIAVVDQPDELLAQALLARPGEADVPAVAAAGDAGVPEARDLLRRLV